MNGTLPVMPWGRSQTIRALIVAALAQLLGSTTVGQLVGVEHLPLVIDKALEAIALAATGYAAWARARKPTPPITQAAAARTAEMK
jgi:hypothetical protein